MQTGGTKIEKKKTCAENRNMITVVGVRFKAAGKIYYFDPEKLDLDIGDCVIVETARGWNTEKSPRRPARSVKNPWFSLSRK